MIRRFLSLAVVGLLLVGGWMGLERLTLYPFDPRRTAPPPALTETEVETRDGKTLVVWSAAPAPGKAVVLYFHGNAGNLAAREGRFAGFTRRGLGLVAAGYRGSSGSSGWPSEAALIADAGLLAERLPELAGDGPVACYGESLGSAVAIALAETGACDAVILEAPFASLRAMAGALYGVSELALLLRSNWPSVERAGGVTVPLLVLHGTNDRLIPIEQGRAVFDAAASAEKRFVPVAGAGHTNVWQPDAQRLLFAYLGALR